MKWLHPLRLVRALVLGDPLDDPLLDLSNGELNDLCLDITGDRVGRGSYTLEHYMRDLAQFPVIYAEIAAFRPKWLHNRLYMWLGVRKSSLKDSISRERSERRVAAAKAALNLHD